MKRIGLYIIPIILLIVGTVLVSCYEPPHIHKYGEWTIATPSTCSIAGTEVRVCSCGEYESRYASMKPHTTTLVTAEEATCECEGKVIEICTDCKSTFKSMVTPAKKHTFKDGYCTTCNVNYHESRDAKYDELRKIADIIALERSQDLAKNSVESTHLFELLSCQIVESDNYFRYLTKVEYKLSTEKEPITKHYLLELFCNLSGTALYYEVDEYTVQEFKERLSWGFMPKDFTLEFFDTIRNPERVSIKDLLANPFQYNGHYVVIKETLVYVSRKLTSNVVCFCLSTGSNKNQYDSEIHITARYIYCEYSDYLIELDPNYQKLFACGYVKLSADGKTPFLELYEFGINP